jgi:predicted permease
VEGLVGAHAEVVLLGPPLVIAALGTAAAAPMALILAVDGAMLAALTPLMMALGTSGRSNPTTLAMDIARRIFLNRLVLATIAGFMAAAIGLRMPAPIDALLSLLRQAAAPLALFVLGAALPFHPIKSLDAELPLLPAVKLVGHPMIVYLLLSWVGGFDRIWVGTAVLMAALPPTANVLAIAQEYGIASERVATMILLATAASIATVTVAVVLVVNGVLPVPSVR